jgi:hypothetical protein
MTVTELDSDDEYETPEQAQARLATTIRDGLLAGLTANASRTEPDVVTVDYAVFNDPEFWEPLYASGELGEDMRQMLDEPMHTTGNLRSAVKFADLRNEERARQSKMDKYGPVKVRTQRVTKSPWEDVSYDDIDAARRR